MSKRQLKAQRKANVEAYKAVIEKKAMQQLQPSRDVAEQYAAWFEPSETQIFQCYWPRQNGSGPAEHFAGKLSQCWDKITALNVTDSASIGFAVNRIAPGASATNDDVTDIRAVWLSADHARFDGCKLQPTFRIQTSPGHYHYYWVVSDGWKADAQGKRDFASVQRTIATLYDGEAKAISQKLRMPGTLNHKPEVVEKNGGPWPVTYELLSGGKYTREELLECFPPMPAPEKSTGPVRYGDDMDMLGWTADQLDAIDPDLPHNDWIAVLIALKSLGEVGFELAREWSAKGTKFEVQQPFETDWKSCKTGDLSELENIARKYRKLVTPAKQHRPATWIETPRKPNDLAARAMANTKAFLESRANKPSDEMYKGLEQITVAIQAMADGTETLGRDFHLSSMPAGAGKTTAVINSVRNLTRMPEYRDVGVLILLGRIDEMQRVSEALELDPAKYAIIANWMDPINNLGNPNKTEAQVLFITQQRLDRLCKEHKSFADMTGLHFNGKPRQVRIWDEALTPFEAVVCGGDTVNDLYRKLKDSNKSAAGMFFEFETVLRNTKDQGTATVPVFEEYGLTLEGVKALADGEEQEEEFENMFRFSGLTCRVRKGEFGRQVLQYVETFPADLGPMAVMDASGPHRGVYRLWHSSENRKQKLKFLYSPQKRYDPVTVYHWNRGAGVNQYKKRDAWLELAKETAKAIRNIPHDEPVLVVHRKPKKQMVDMAKAITAELKNRPNVHFCTWGMHKATNKFVDCKHVFLVGLLQYGAATEEAYGRGAKLIEANENLSEEDHEAVRLGEIKDNALQAVNRINIRHTIGDTCPAGCSVWMVFSTQRSGAIPEDIIGDILPGTSILPWTPVKRVLGENTVKVADALATFGEGEHRKGHVIGPLGITNSHRAWGDPELPGLMVERGWKIEAMTKQTVTLSPHERGGEREMEIPDLPEQFELPID